MLYPIKAVGLLLLLITAFATPVYSQTGTDQTTTTTADDDGFDDWGLLGLLGLAGLLGRNKRDRTVTDTRRV